MTNGVQELCRLHFSAQRQIPDAEALVAGVNLHSESKLSHFLFKEPSGCPSLLRWPPCWSCRSRRTRNCTRVSRAIRKWSCNMRTRWSSLWLLYATRIFTSALVMPKQHSLTVFLFRISEAHVDNSYKSIEALMRSEHEYTETVMKAIKTLNAKYTNARDFHIQTGSKLDDLPLRWAYVQRHTLTLSFSCRWPNWTVCTVADFTTIFTDCGLCWGAVA